MTLRVRVAFEPGFGDDEPMWGKPDRPPQTARELLMWVTRGERDFSPVDEGGRQIRARLRGAKLIGANLQGVDLFKADLASADLTGANLNRAELHEVNFTDATLKGASLREADLFKANLTRANLKGADLLGADLKSARLEGTLIFPSTARVSEWSAEMVCDLVRRGALIQAWADWPEAFQTAMGGLVQVG